MGSDRRLDVRVAASPERPLPMEPFGALLLDGHPGQPTHEYHGGERHRGEEAIGKETLEEVIEIHNVLIFAYHATEFAKGRGNCREAGGSRGVLVDSPGEKTGVFLGGSRSADGSSARFEVNRSVSAASAVS